MGTGNDGDGQAREGGGRLPARVPDAKVGLSSAAVYPLTTADAFEMASTLGFDGLELMVWTDPVSQDLDAVEALRDHHDLPVLAIHAPCLLITQRVWSPDPWERLTRSVDAAVRLDASTVVVHPPFRWQKDYARDFVRRVRQLEQDSGVEIAVENMYPWRAAGRELAAYLPDWDPSDEDYAHCTLDLSHTAVSGSDALAMAADMGERLSHVHMTDGTGSARDEHLVPGRGSQPCAVLLDRLARMSWSKTIILEVSTRRARSQQEREMDLAESLAFTRLHLATASDTAFAVGGDGVVEEIYRGPS